MMSLRLDTLLGIVVAIALGFCGQRSDGRGCGSQDPVEMEQKIGDAAFSSHALANKLVTEEAILEDFKLSDPLLEAAR